MKIWENSFDVWNLRRKYNKVENLSDDLKFTCKFILVSAPSLFIIQFILIWNIEIEYFHFYLYKKNYFNYLFN